MHIYLNHNIIGSGADQSSDARVVFTWDTGDSTNPGSGMVTSVEAQRPGTGSTWHTAQRVNYTYSHDDGEIEQHAEILAEYDFGHGYR